MPDVLPKIAEVVDRALKYEPKDRYPDAESMRAAVKEALAALDEQDGKATLAGQANGEQLKKASAPSHPSANDDDVDDAAKTIPVSDFARQKTTPATGEVRSDMILEGARATSEPGANDSSPRARAVTASKPNLWVHTKATPPEPPREPKKRRRLLPIAIGLVALGAAGVGAAYMWPRWHGGASASGSSSGANVVAGPVAGNDDPDADVDGGDDDIEVDDDDASAAPAASASSHAAKPTARPAATHTKPHVKKKRR